MDWFLHDEGLRHERFKEIHTNRQVTRPEHISEIHSDVESQQ